MSESQPFTPASQPISLMQRISNVFERRWFQVLVLGSLGFLVRLPALTGELIWDDQFLAHDNPFIKSPLLIPETFRHYLFPDSLSTHYRPVQNISYCFDYLIWNEATSGYHLTNIVLHVGTGVLLFFLLQHIVRVLLSGRGTPADRRLVDGSAFIVALLWIVHPVHSAAVDYISGRADSLAAFFACGGWLLYLAARQNRSIAASGLLFAAAASSALLALCSRESAGIWMLLFLVYVFAVERKSSRPAKIFVAVATLCVFAAYVALRHLPTARPTHIGFGGQPLESRVVLMLRALGDYTRLMFAPINLHMDRTVHPPAAILGLEGWRFSIGVEYLSILGFAAGTALIVGAMWKGKARPLRAFGAAWFLLAYLPISNLLQLNATVAEHWLYLPSIGFLLFLLGCALELPAHHRKWLHAVALVAALGLGARSFVRSGDWLTPEAFYRHALKSGSEKTRVALNLGQIYSTRGDYGKAEPLLRKVVELAPDYPMARNALADLLFKQGKKKEAADLFAVSAAEAAKTREEYPRTWIAALNVAHLRYGQHDHDGALAAIQAAVRDYPSTWELISFEAEMLRQRGGAREALPLVENFARENWWHAAAAIALGKLYWEAGDIAKAEEAFRHATRLDVYATEPLNLLAALELRNNRVDLAFEAQRRAVSRQPDQPQQYVLLSDILEKMGRTNEAHDALARFAQLKAIAHSQAALN